MTQKIFNLGFSKTGTTTFEYACKELGYKVCRGHWALNYCFYLFALCVNQDYEEIFRMIQYWDAFSDGPWGGGTDLYKELYRQLPDSKFILTVRDSEQWYKSFENQIMIFEKNPETALDIYHANGMWGSAYWFKHVFDIDKLAGNKQKIMDKYNCYNSKVIQFFRDKNADFIVFDIFNGDGWEKLCHFLAKDIPKVPFPQVNKSPVDWKKFREQTLYKVKTDLFWETPQEREGKKLRNKMRESIKKLVKKLMII